MRAARQLALAFALCALGPMSTATTAAAQQSQPRSHTIGPDDMGVCCRITANGKERFFRTNQGNCSYRKGTAVANELCPERATGGTGSLVCCEFQSASAGVVFDQFAKQVSRVLMTTEKCKEQPHSKVVAKEHCVKKRTRAERLRACKERGEGFEFVNGRCLRPSVRDKRKDQRTRAERIRDCKERGEGFRYVNGRCLRPSVRDKRKDPQ